MRKGAFIKGIMTGMLVGAAVSLAVNPIDDKRMRSLKRGMGRVARRVGANLEDMMN